jgi:hypothetical protein
MDKTEGIPEPSWLKRLDDPRDIHPTKMACLPRPDWDEMYKYLPATSRTRNTSDQAKILDYIATILNTDITDKAKLNNNFLVSKLKSTDLKNTPYWTLYNQVRENLRKVNLYIAIKEGQHRALAAEFAIKYIERSNMLGVSNCYYLSSNIPISLETWSGTNDYIQSCIQESDDIINNQLTIFQLTMFDDFVSCPLTVDIINLTCYEDIITFLKRQCTVIAAFLCQSKIWNGHFSQMLKGTPTFVVPIPVGSVAGTQTPLEMYMQTITAHIVNKLISELWFRNTPNVQLKAKSPSDQTVLDVGVHQFSFHLHTFTYLQPIDNILFQHDSRIHLAAVVKARPLLFSSAKENIFSELCILLTYLYNIYDLLQSKDTLPPFIHYTRVTDPRTGKNHLLYTQVFVHMVYLLQDFYSFVLMTDTTFFEEMKKYRSIYYQLENPPQVKNWFDKFVGGSAGLFSFILFTCYHWMDSCSNDFIAAVTLFREGLLRRSSASQVDRSNNNESMTIETVMVDCPSFFSFTRKRYNLFTICSIHLVNFLQRHENDLSKIVRNSTVDTTTKQVVSNEVDQTTVKESREGRDNLKNVQKSTRIDVLQPTSTASAPSQNTDNGTDDIDFAKTDNTDNTENIEKQGIDKSSEHFPPRGENPEMNDELNESSHARMTGSIQESTNTTDSTKETVDQIEKDAQPTDAEESPKGTEGMNNLHQNADSTMPSGQQDTDEEAQPKRSEEMPKETDVMQNSPQNPDKTIPEKQQETGTEQSIGKYRKWSV